MCLVDECRSVAIYELASKSEHKLLRKFSCGPGILVDQIVYCKTGDYLALIGHRDGRVCLLAALKWRQSSVDPIITELDVNKAPPNDEGRAEKLSNIDCCQRTGNLAASFGDTILIYELVESLGNRNESIFNHIISVKLSFWALKINLAENYLSVMAMDHVQVLRLELFDSSDLNVDSSNQSADDCITWNLNTKKLVKLPTLMHNTSTNLTSFHICHPLELLGPASESIACRISASIYSADFCENQLEAVVMLCKQFDLYRDPVKSVQLQAVYLGSREDRERLCKSSRDCASSAAHYYSNFGMNHPNGDECNSCDTEQQSNYFAKAIGKGASLLKSEQYDQLVSVSCLVSTLTHCFVYNLHGKKVVRLQTITHPDLCLDLRSDLLNIYLLTPVGLQICSSAVCDSTFRYDWSSSGDLNLSFIARDKIIRVLTSSRFLILLARPPDDEACYVELSRKPSLSELYARIVDTVAHCNSISIRTNLLTYLHAQTHLTLSTIRHRPGQMITLTSGGDESSLVDSLKQVTIMLCKQLIQKKQTNVITNSKIDKAIKHLLDISMCNLMELMDRYLHSQGKPRANRRGDDWETSGPIPEVGEFSGADSLASGEFQSVRSLDQSRLDSTRATTESSLVELEFEQPLDVDYELVRIYLKHAKFSQPLLDYLIENSSNDGLGCHLIGLMFEHNPRLLIKCAQRYALQLDRKRELESMLLLLVDKLKLLAEFDSTGINRATVLFTLAILYNALDERQKCISALDQIKPLNHLAITMSSHYELAEPIASLVHEVYPDVFNLFLNQLAKRDKPAAKQFCALLSLDGPSRLAGLKDEPLGRGEPRGRPASLARARPPSSLDDADESASFNLIKYPRDSDSEQQLQLQLQLQEDDDKQEDEDEDEDESDWFGQKLRLVAEIPTGQLVELLDQLADGPQDESAQRIKRAYLEASIRLLEAEFILARLRDNCY